MSIVSKFVEQLLKLIIVFLIFFGIFIYYSCGNSSGCENNLSTSQEEETKQYLSDSQEDTIAKQQELFDFYHKQKSLMDENETLHEIINIQEIELEDKERQIKTQEKQVQAPIEHAKVDVSTVKKSEEVGQQLAKETRRVVHQVNREAKRILKKF